LISDVVTVSGTTLGESDIGGRLPEVCHWYALWTHSHCERLVYDHLTAKGFQAFFPTIEVWSRRGGLRHRIQVPMFPGYLFVHHAMDKAGYIAVRQTRGLVSVLGERWDRLSVIPDQEIYSIQALRDSRLPVLPHTFLRDGERVRIVRGPLADAEGILLRQKPSTGLLVLSIELLQRSVAVEIDCTLVVPA
jgi:transcription antitermination factor NusG